MASVFHISRASSVILLLVLQSAQAAEGTRATIVARNETPTAKTELKLDEVIPNSGVCTTVGGDGCSKGDFNCQSDEFSATHADKIGRVLEKVCGCGRRWPWSSWKFELEYSIVAASEGEASKVCFKGRGCEMKSESRDISMCFPNAPDTKLCAGEVCSCKARGAPFRFADEVAEGGSRAARHLNEDLLAIELPLPFFRQVHANSLVVEGPFRFFEKNKLVPEKQMRLEVADTFEAASSDTGSVVVFEKGCHLEVIDLLPDMEAVLVKKTIRVMDEATNQLKEELKGESVMIPYGKGFREKILHKLVPLQTKPLGHALEVGYHHVGSPSAYVNEAYAVTLKYDEDATRKVYPEASRKDFRDRFSVNCFRLGNEFEDGQCNCVAAEKSKVFRMPVSRHHTPLDLSPEYIAELKAAPEYIAELSPNLLAETAEYGRAAGWEKGWKDLFALSHMDTRSVSEAAAGVFHKKHYHWYKTSGEDTSRLLLYALAGVTLDTYEHARVPLGTFSYTGLLSGSPEQALESIDIALKPQEDEAVAWGRVMLLTLTLRTPDSKCGGATHSIFVSEHATGKLIQLQAKSSTDHKTFKVAYDLWAWLSGITLYSDGEPSIKTAISEHGGLKSFPTKHFMELFKVILADEEDDPFGDDFDVFAPDLTSTDAYERLFGCRIADTESFAIDLGTSSVFAAPVLGTPIHGFAVLEGILRNMTAAKEPAAEKQQQQQVQEQEVFPIHAVFSKNMEAEGQKRKRDESTKETPRMAALRRLASGEGGGTEAEKERAQRRLATMVLHEK